MKKLKLCILAIAALMAVASCQKEKDPITPVDPGQPDQPEVVDPCNTYIGSYDFLSVYDSVGVDGTWFENGFAGMEYDPTEGYLVITKDESSDSTMKLDGYEVVVDDETGAADTLHFYETKIHILPDGTATIKNSTFSAGNGINFDIAYGNIHRNEDGVLTFRTVQTCIYGGYELGYICTCTCTPRQ